MKVSHQGHQAMDLAIFHENDFEVFSSHNVLC